MAKKVFTPGNPGKPFGARDKKPREGSLRQMAMNVLHRAGGEEYLLQVAISDPPTFFKLLVKAMPQEITGTDGKDLIPETWSDTEIARRIAYILNAADREVSKGHAAQH